MASVQLGSIPLVRLLARRRRLASRELWTRPQLRVHQGEALSKLRRFAIERSPFYREYHARSIQEALTELPVMTKTILMDRWDDVVTDRSLSREDVLRFVEGLTEPALLPDRHFVATTSGTTGLKGVFAYDLYEWLWILASYARANDWAGVPAGLKHRLRLAVVSTTVPWHQSAIVGASLKGPLVPTLRLDATRPMSDLVEALNSFGPESLVAYASVAEPLAHEQIAGRLRVKPRAVFCASEVLTETARHAVHEGFGVEPFETYAATETASIASECHLHRLHLYEDLVVTPRPCSSTRAGPSPSWAGARCAIEQPR